MTAVLSPGPKQQFLDNNGRPFVDGKLFTYQAGTTTKLATYTDSTGGSQNTNPIILDYRGECDLWIPPNVAYKYVLAPGNDTDPPTNPIWTIDQIVSSQLVTLYGGVDTGVADAYVLNFDANFSAYQDGIVIYWIVANTNTGGSTINVNGLGPVLILNQNLGGLVAGQLEAGQVAVIMYDGGVFKLISSGQVSNITGTVNLNATGFTTSPQSACHYDINGHTACLQFGPFTATSNATSFTLTDLPALLRPSQTQQVSISGTLLDNGSVLVSGEVLFTGSSDTVTFTVLGVAAAFTGSGTKGINRRFSVSYVLN
jgi:hypothetical protein